MNNKGGLGAQKKARIRADVQNGYGDMILDAALQRRYKKLEAEKYRPHTPITPRWVDVMPPVTRGDVDAYCQAKAGSPIVWAMPGDRQDRTDPALDRRRGISQYERIYGAAAERERLRAQTRTPLQKKKHAAYLARKAKKEGGR